MDSMTWSHGQRIDAMMNTTIDDHIDTKVEVDTEEEQEHQQPMFHVF